MKLSGKNDKKIRKLVRQREALLVSQSWNCFFDTIKKLPLRYRMKLAWFVFTGNDINKVKNKAARKAMKKAMKKAAKK